MTSKKLFLTSSGICNPTLKNEYSKLVGKTKSSVRTLFVPTAADPEQVKDYVGWAREEITELSGSVTEFDLKAHTPLQFEEALQKSDVLYVNGGNTFYLLYWALEVQMFDALKKFLSRGGVYVGVSAGSILVCPTIEVAGWKGADDSSVVKLESLVAANLIDIHLFPHFNSHWEETVTHEKAALKAELVTLRDGDAYVVDGPLERLLRGS